LRRRRSEVSRINRYILTNLLTVLGLAVGVCSFLLIIGYVARVFDLFTAGFRIVPLLLFVAYYIPQTLGFTIPLGMLLAGILVFNRMSAENEITALRSSGISVVQIIAPAVLLSLFMSVICAALQFHFGPEVKHRAKWLVKEEAVKTPMAFIEEKNRVELMKGFFIEVSERHDDRLKDVHILIVKNKRIDRKIFARSGKFTYNDATGELTLSLKDATIVDYSQESGTHLGEVEVRRTHAEEFSYPIDTTASLQRKPLVRRVVEMTLPQLFAQIRLNAEKGNKDSTLLYVELNRRAAMALAPFAFLLIAIPFGLRQSPRKDSWFGIVASVAIAMLFYVAVTAVGTLQHNPELHPELLIWLPTLACQLGGLTALWLRR